MAGRPLKQGADWFKHDRDMRHDPKVLALRRRFGSDGFAAWVMTLEALTDAGGFACEIDGAAPELFAGDFGIPANLLMEIWAYCETLGLLQRSDGRLYSARHQERMADLVASRERNARRKATARAGKKHCLAGQTPDIGIVRPEKGVTLALSGILEESREEVLDTSSLTRLSSPSFGAGGASGGASAPTVPTVPTAADAPGRPEPMRPDHLATLESRAATGDRFALEALRRARQDGRLPHLPRPAAGGSTPAPTSPPDPPPPANHGEDIRIDGVDDWDDEPTEATR